jgi:hypothetical protein
MKKPLATLSAALLAVVAISMLSGCVVVRPRPARPPARVIVVR